MRHLLLQPFLLKRHATLSPRIVLLLLQAVLLMLLMLLLSLLLLLYEDCFALLQFESLLH